MSCVNCHAINGPGAARAGRPGSDASREPPNARRRSRHEQHAGRISAAGWQNPQAVKPGVKMPDYKFTDEQVAQLTDYFETLQ